MNSFTAHPYINVLGGLLFVLFLVSSFTCRGRLCWKKFKDEPATFVVTMVIWLLGAAYCIRTTNLIGYLTSGNSFQGIQQIFRGELIFVCWVSLLHQFLIFLSLHHLDHNPAVRKSLQNWFGHPVEWFLRLVAIVLLLCLCGEVPRLMSELLKNGSPEVVSVLSREPLPSVDSTPPNETAMENGYDSDSTITKEKAQKAKEKVDDYASYATALFFVLFIWDVWGWSKCKWKWEIWPPDGPTYYLLSDLFGLLTWASVTIALFLANWQILALVVPMLLLVIYTACIGLRAWRRVGNFFKALNEEILSNPT